jgi:cyclophilin family peptidyl-prolyl cis-trans isomerase
MYLKIKQMSMMLILISNYYFAQTLSKETVLIETSFGNMKVKLYNETPLHKANFLKLVNQHFYDSLLFHRIIEGFMIQGGDPYSKHADAFTLLGDSDLHYTIPSEFNPNLFHKKGVICAARNGDDVNPEKASSAVQFYIVQGKVRNEDDFKKFEKRINKDLVNKLNADRLLMPENANLKQQIEIFKAQKNQDSLLVYNKKLDDLIAVDYDKATKYVISKAHKEVYKTIGGTPHLDNNYTVFGEVIDGIDVIDKIAKEKTNKNDRPLTNIRMKIYVLN